jgi:restriction system protein
MGFFTYKYDQLYNPLLQALRNLGGSANISEIDEEVAKILNLSDEAINDIHKGNRTKLSYRLAWARFYLRRYGLLENSARGIWSLTAEGLKVDSVDESEVTKTVKAEDLKKKQDAEANADANDDIEDGPTEELEWQDELLNIVKEIKPDAFERLCQRMLRELGFLNVEVTGKSGDGGIDGKGIVQLGGVLSFHIVFQCKRYQGSISSSIIRDFRGAMIGRADKGLVITTGTFTRDSRIEAQRDGAPPIDLIDGYQLAEKLKDLKLGVETYTVEQVKIKADWFSNI